MRNWITEKLGNLLKAALGFEAGVAGVRTGAWSQTAWIQSLWPSNLSFQVCGMGIMIGLAL